MKSPRNQNATVTSVMDGPNFRWWYQRRRRRQAGGCFDMSPASLKDLCREQRLYASCPELNQVLHLHQKGIVIIENLHEYTGLKTLHLECNGAGRAHHDFFVAAAAISKIQGLDNLVNLRCLHLNQNLVQDVEGLANLPMLETLDLADNQIKCIRGLSCCPALRQLNVSGNRICMEEDVAHLSECKSLVSLDISRNEIDNEKALEVLRSLLLTLMKMSGNPIVSKTQHYRKMTVVYMSMLKYLDDSPVSDNERRLATSWFEGGVKGEAVMREVIRKEEDVQRLANHRAFEAMIERVSAEASAEQERRLAALENEEPEHNSPALGRIVPCKKEGEAGADETLGEGLNVYSEGGGKTVNITSEAGGALDSGSEEAVRSFQEDPIGVGNNMQEIEAEAEVDEPQAQGVNTQVDEPIQEVDAECVDAEVIEPAAEVDAEQLAVAEREREFVKELQRKARERAAGRGSKPGVWGTELYRALWDGAVHTHE